MADDLKSCPFCGSTDIDARTDEGLEGLVDYVYFAVCGDCGATGPVSPINAVGARWLWNMRAEPKAEARDA